MELRIPVIRVILLLLLIIGEVVEIQARPTPRAPPLTRQQAREFRRLNLGRNVVGPESVAIDPEDEENPFVGGSDGIIYKWNERNQTFHKFATIPNRPRSCDGPNSPGEKSCGRPLGLKFNPRTRELYWADSTFGLFKVGREGGEGTLLASGVGGKPFNFLNGLDIDPDTGAVYCTDTSLHYHRWEYQTAMGTFDHTGRLLKYDPRDGSVTVLLEGLYFANGVALSKHKDFVLVAETMAYRITRYWLKGEKAETSDRFLQLRGRPDNINRTSNGDFWIAQNPTPPIKVNEHGQVLEVLITSAIKDVSDVFEYKKRLYIGSVVQRYLLRST